MSRLTKSLLGVVLLIVVAAGAALAFLFLRYPNVPPAEEVTVAVTPDRLARGEYLATHVSGCIDCHSQRDWSKFAGPITPGTEGKGGDFFGEPGSAVQLWAPNITPAAVGDWTDGELIRAITTGVARSGRALFPIMPYPMYAQMAREDIEAIVAYIRTLAPIEHTAPARQLGFPLPLVVRTMPAPAAFRPVPPKTDRVAYGEYMTTAAACADCHTPQEQGAPIPGMTFAGGFEFVMKSGMRIRSANITPDADTGIGTWTEEQFVDKFKAFEHAPLQVLSDAEQRENTYMPWYLYAGQTREDLGAIYTYLRTLKPVVNRVTIRP
jgi:mono/diheme cytochrome c family protein